MEKQVTSTPENVVGSRSLCSHVSISVLILRPAKTSISLSICLVRSEYLMCIYWKAKDHRFVHAPSNNLWA